MVLGFVCFYFFFSVFKKYWDMYDFDDLFMFKYKKVFKDVFVWVVKRRGEIL